jgi:hypothetical protein
MHIAEEAGEEHCLAGAINPAFRDGIKVERTG